MNDYSERVADRLEIHELLARYARMVDFREWHLHDEVYTEDATADYTGTAGIAGSATEVMTWLDRALAAWPVNMHMLSNIVVDFTGPDGASSTCYFMGPMGVGDVGSQLVITNAGLYVDRLERTAAGWRIAHRDCKLLLMMGALPDGYEIPE
jgi:hypothetical protein